MTKIVSYFLLILMTASSLYAEQPTLIIAPPEERPWVSLRKGHLITYEAVLNVIHDLEDEEWLETCSEEELKEAIQFIVLLARLGAIPGETDVEQLEKDTQELLNFDDDDEEE